MILRPYQQQLDYEVDQAWAKGAQNVLMRLATGGGKTILLATIVKRHRGASCVIAHRDNLVLQLSLALAEAGIVHNIIASRETRQQVVAAHFLKLGRSYYDPGALCAVASVRTLARVKGLDHWFAQVTLWVVDEGHHLVVDNEWHTAICKFTNPYVRGLLPTATPERADGKGLGRHADGVADVMVEGPPERWLIDEGYLTDYRIVMAESDVVELLAAEKIGASGDYSPAVLKRTARKSHIVGDVVKDYLSWAPGKLWITFAPSVETAVDMAAAYNAAGVRAEVLTGDTPYGMRFSLLRRFEAREILQLVVVDIVSEGFDLPAIEGASSTRKTESLPVYRQQFGRTLRPMWAPGAGLGPAHRFDLDTRRGRLDAIEAGPKPRAMWIDHVNNVGNPKLGVPDRVKVWTLDRKGDRKGGGGDGIPLRTCLNVEGRIAPPEQADRIRADLVMARHADGSVSVGRCAQPYRRALLACPYCGTPAPPPASRGSPDAVEGDLAELDAETLARLRGAVEARDMGIEEYRVHALQTMPTVAVMANVRRHAEAQDAQATLRASMTEWVRARLAEGLRDREVHRAWWHTFGVDVLSARALNRADALALDARVRAGI